ncbi:MAG: DNA repair protein RecN [Bacillota bacterium]
MLNEVYIKNFILIKEESITFKNGLNIITGETGAGKSIILQALAVLLGDPAKTDYIGAFEETSIIEASFNVGPKAKELLKSQGFQIDDDEVIITRELRKNLSTISRLNGRRVKVSFLKKLENYLLDFHGQNKHQELLDESNHIKYLDSIDDENLKNKLEKIKNIYRKIQKNKKELKKYKKLNKEKNREMEFIEFQLNEIKEANLKKDEYEKLLKENKFFNNQEQISEIFNQASSDLSSEKGIYDKIENLVFNFEKIKTFDDKIESILNELNELLYLSESISEQVDEYMYSIEYDELRVKQVKNRLNKINEIMKKYGNSYEEIKEYQNKLSDRLKEYNELEEKITKLQNSNKELLKKYKDIANKIHKIRLKNAKKFEKMINNEFNELNMKNAQLKINIDKTDEIYENGMDKVNFLISTNVGQSFKNIKEVISGGELSRTMLAIKLITKKINSTPTLIFDEVDTGISGKTANIVGQKLNKISENYQIITITHLPQIACYALHHILVDKEVDKETKKTVSFMKVLDSKQRVNAIARLISGEKITESSIKNAKLLLDKNNIN